MEKLYKLEGDKEVEVILPNEVAEMNIQLKSIDQNFMKISAWGNLPDGIHYILDLESKAIKVENIIPFNENSSFDNLEVKNHSHPKVL